MRHFGFTVFSTITKWTSTTTRVEFLSSTATSSVLEDFFTLFSEQYVPFKVSANYGMTHLRQA